MVIAPAKDYLKFIPAIQQTPQQSIWLTYDKDADVLYVNFAKPSTATDSELTDDDVIVRYDGNDVIGYTILHASELNLTPLFIGIGRRTPITISNQQDLQPLDLSRRNNPQ